MSHNTSVPLRLPAGCAFEIICSYFSFHLTSATVDSADSYSTLSLFVSVYLCLSFSFSFAPGETNSHLLFPRRQVNALGFTVVSTV
jgi:hypothetical protein